MKFLVYGGHGWIGQYIVRIIESANDTIIHGQRVEGLETVLADMLEHRPDRVICALGRTYGPTNPTVDYLELPGKLITNLRDNLSAPVFIAQATQHRGDQLAVPVLYIGSGCIFEYDGECKLNGPDGFTEKHKPNFFGSSYSAVKSQTDQIMVGFPHVLCARVRMPISDDHHPRDFITKIRGYKKIVSIPNSMTVLSDIIPFLIGCLVEGRTGILNAVNPGVIDHAEILRIYENIEGKKHDFELISEEEQSKMLLSRRSNNYLESSTAEAWIAGMSKETKLQYNIPHRFLPLKQRIVEIIKHREGHLPLEIKGGERTPRVLLVTGGAGFIGSNFINYWMRKYPEDRIVNFDCLGRWSNIRNVECADSPNYRFIQGNLLDQSLIDDIVKSNNFSHVVHFAASSNVDLSFTSPLEYVRSNILGTYNLLEAVRKFGKMEMFLFISTDEVYGEVAEGTSSEQTSIFRPSNPYAATKASAECLVMSYGKSFKLPYIITRANNVYGRYQFPINAVPLFTVNLLKKQKLPVHGQGAALRRFLHVTDKCRGLDVLLEKGQSGEVYNIGCGDEVSVLDLCGLLLKKIHGEEERVEDWVTFVADRCHNDCRYSLDSTKLEMLGWKPEVNFEEGLEDTVSWYRNNLDHWDQSETLSSTKPTKRSRLVSENLAVLVDRDR